MNRRFVVVGFNPQNLIAYNRGVLSLRAAYKSQNNKLLQTNYDSNVHIATFDHEPSAPKNKPSQTRRAVTSRRRLFYSLPLRSGGRAGDGGTRHPSETNRIQREFLFNNGIHSQNISSASKHPRQKTNFSKQLVLLPSLAKRGKGWGWGMLSLRVVKKEGGVGGGDCAAEKGICGKKRAY
jgi:hypothetical protein